MVQNKKDVVYAATQWFGYDPKSIFSPKIGEWCLFTLVINGRRNYFSGRIIETATGAIRVYWDGLGTFEIDDTLYWARVRTFYSANQGKLEDVGDDKVKGDAE